MAGVSCEAGDAYSWPAPDPRHSCARALAPHPVG